MADKLLLLLFGAIAACIAWAGWHFLGENAGHVLTIVALVILVADNVRLRRALREKGRS